MTEQYKKPIRLLFPNWLFVFRKILTETKSSEIQKNEDEIFNIMSE